MTNILAFAGSLRSNSWNKRLVQLAAQGAESVGAQVTSIDLADYPLPIFNQDLEDSDGMPENALRLKDMMTQSDGLLIASPEYNGSLTAALKNAIDWVSRSSADESPMALSAFRGKSAALLATSPGGLGGLRGLVHLRAILSGLGVTVIPGEIAIPHAHAAFSDDGLNDQKKQAQVVALGEQLARVTAKLA